MRQHTLFTGVSVEHQSLITRLATEFLEASREFRKDPKRYIESAFRADRVGGQRRKTLLRFGLAVGLIFYSVMFVTLLILGGISRSITEADGSPKVFIFNPIFAQKRVSDLPKAKDESGGGGGGGNRSLTPPSQGEPPEAALLQQIVAPTTRPQLTPPVLAVTPIVSVDPSLLRRDDLAPMGLPAGVDSPPSDGPGSGNGIGSGNGGGVGPGDGGGLGPGSRGGTGGNFNQRGGNPYGRDQESVDLRPAALNRPRPSYTEEARKNKVQGTVRLRVLVGNDGLVKQVRAITFLSEGLTEEAIRAAQQMRFRPAMRNGRAVDYWIPVDIEFNLR